MCTYSFFGMRGGGTGRCFGGTVGTAASTQRSNSAMSMSVKSKIRG